MIKLYDSRYHFRLLKKKYLGNTDLFLKKSMRGKVFGFGNDTYLYAYRSLMACEQSDDEKLKSWLWDFEEQMVDCILQFEGVDYDFDISHYSLEKKEDVEWYGKRNERKIYYLPADNQLKNAFEFYYEMNNCDVYKAIADTKKERNALLDNYPDMSEVEWWRVFSFYARIADLAKEFAFSSQKPKEEKLQITMGEKEYQIPFEDIMDHIKLDKAADQLGHSW